MGKIRTNRKISYDNWKPKSRDCVRPCKLKSRDCGAQSKESGGYDNWKPKSRDCVSLNQGMGVHFPRKRERQDPRFVSTNLGKEDLVRKSMTPRIRKK